MTTARPNPRIFAVVVTYRRSEVAQSTIERLMAQTRPPDHLLLVDNDPTDEMGRWFAEVSSDPYIEAGENLGPAGGIALGMESVLDVADENDWILLVDDDDPPPSDDALERLVATIETVGDPRLGGVGLVGARFDRRRALMRRIPDDELVGPVDVDCIAGNQMPMYRVACIRQVGRFDSSLFFGFEELEFGLRVRTAGWRLVVDGAQMYRLREAKGRLGLGPRTKGDGLPPWRRYYSSRNIVEIARRHGTGGAIWWAIAHGGVAAAGRSLIVQRNAHASWAALRGAFDGLRRRSGRVMVP